MKYRIALLTTLLAAAAAVFAGPPDATTHVVGDDKVIWLISYNRQTKLASVAGRAAGKERWVIAASGARGMPSAVCADGGELHVFFVGAGHQVYRLDRHSGSGGYWPGDLRGSTAVAACPGRGDTPPRTFFVLVATPDQAKSPTAASAPAPGPARAPAGKPSVTTSPALTSGPASQPAPTAATASSQPASSPASKPAASGPVIFAACDGRWRRITTVPTEDLPAGTLYHMADTPKGLYVLATTLGMPVWHGRYVTTGNEEGGRWLPLAAGDWTTADGEIRQVLSTPADLWLFGVDGQSGRRAYLRSVDAETGVPGKTTQITLDGQPLTLPDGTDLSAGNYGEKLAIAWGRESVRSVGLLELGGEIRDPADYDLSSNNDMANAVAKYLKWGPIALTSVLLFGLALRWHSSRGKAFQLPPPLIPAMWPKRILAFALDFLPFLFAVAIVGSRDDAPPQDVQDILRRALERGEDILFDPEAIRATLLVLVAFAMHATYAAVMETLVGRTVGKTLLRLRVVANDGRRASLGACLIRNFTKIVELLSPAYLLFLAWPIFTRHRQRAGDMVAGTTVVDIALTMRMRAMNAQATPPSPSPPDLPGKDRNPDDTTDDGPES